MSGLFSNKKRKRSSDMTASLGLEVSLTDEDINEAWSMTMKAHKSPKEPYQLKKYKSLSRVIFSFPGSWDVNDWFTGHAFQEKKIDLAQFPSLKTIATEEVATVNEAFLRRFQEIFPKIQQKVEKYVKKGKQIVFTGHSSGGPLAVLVTVWFLQEQLKKPDTNNALPPLCVTFGSPLVGDCVFNHALSRENWSQYFTHFIMRYDIVPRIFLSPLSSIKQELILTLPFLNPKPNPKKLPSAEASTLYENVMRNVSSVASNEASKFMGNTNNFLETLSTFVELSPYRPVGTYVFCTEAELVVVKNPDAVLQIFFYASQLPSEQELEGIAMRSIEDHQKYQMKLQSLEKKNVFHLDSLEELPLSSDCKDFAIDRVLNNLGLSPRARLCFCAAREFKKQKLRNQDKFDAKKKDIETRTNWLERYKTSCESRNQSYYDAFKISANHEGDFNDFDANVERLQLAGIFDELMEMIKKCELPDGFEVIEDCIKIGTRYRRLVEPLDIANYYRHLKNADSGSYMIKGRPKRYRFTQKWLEWLEYAKRREIGPSLESCFWAEVEELDACLKNSKIGLSENVKGKISSLEKNVEVWLTRGELGHDIFFENSTFDKWCKTLNRQFGLESFSEVKKRVELSKKGD